MQNTKGEFLTAIKTLYGRKIFNNYDKAVQVVKALGYEKAFKNPTIVDAYPGGGVISAALHNTIKPSKHIFLEPFKNYRTFLQNLEIPNAMVSNLDPYRWSTFSSLEQAGDLVVERQSFDKVHDQLLYTAALTHPQGEQLVAQYLNCIMNRSWLQKYGRVRMLLWLKASTAEKLLPGPGERYRHRLSVQREACCDVKVVFHTPSSAKAIAYPDYPVALRSPMFEWNQRELITAKTQPPITLVELTPRAEQIEHIEEFEYVIRNLFMLRSTPLSGSLNSLGPGASEALAPKLQDILDKKPTALSMGEIARVTTAFYEWPFKPEFLHDFYQEALYGLGSGSADSRI